MSKSKDAAAAPSARHCYAASDRIHEYRDVLDDLHTRYHLTLACLDEMGQSVMKELMEWISLREVARRTNLSPTYLSVVRNGKSTVSPQAFVKLADLLREIESA